MTYSENPTIAHPNNWWSTLNHLLHLLLLYLYLKLLVNIITTVCILQLTSQPQNRYFESESRDWHGRAAQSASSVDEKYWDALHENKEPNKQGSQFGSSIQGPLTQVACIRELRNFPFSLNNVVCLHIFVVKLSFINQFTMQFWSFVSYFTFDLWFSFCCGMFLFYQTYLLKEFLLYVHSKMLYLFLL